MDKKKVYLISGIVMVLVIIFIILLFAFGKKEEPLATVELETEEGTKRVWTYDIYNKDIVEFYGMESNVVKAQNNNEDDKIVLKYTFKALTNGTTKIRFEYKNPDKENAKVKHTIVYEAVVENNKVTMNKLSDKVSN